MGLLSLVHAIYQGIVGSENVRYRQEPTGAALVAVADDAAWDQIFVAATITTDHWIVRVVYRGPDAGITADTEEVLAYGVGGADGAAVAAATLLVEHMVLATITTAVGESMQFPPYLPVPIKVAASTRHAARISSSATGGMALGVGVEYATGLGT